jgi:hypothetical protein
VIPKRAGFGLQSMRSVLGWQQIERAERGAGPSHAGRTQSVAEGSRVTHESHLSGAIRHK